MFGIFTRSHTIVSISFSMRLFFILTAKGKSNYTLYYSRAFYTTILYYLIPFFPGTACSSTEGNIPL